jgi:AraC-like DNA-binding protein
MKRKTTQKTFNIRFKNLFISEQDFINTINSTNLLNIDISDLSEIYKNINARASYYFLKWSIPQLCYNNIAISINKNYKIFKEHESIYNKDFEDIIKNKNKIKNYNMSTSNDLIISELPKHQTNETQTENTFNIAFLEIEQDFKKKKAEIKFKMYDDIISDIIDKFNFYDETHLYDQL